MVSMKDRIKSVRFELSGSCPYKQEHKDFCPSSRIPDSMLESAIILKVMQFLGPEFKGDVGFHNYNEPLADPRLFHIVRKIKEICPDCRVSIWTNGLYLYPKLALEAVDIGVDEFVLTAYSPDSGCRYASMEKIKIYAVHLDDRLKNYTRPVQNSRAPCDAPFGQLIVNRFGQVALCCMDWQYTMTFGDLHSKELEDCFKAMDEVYQNLINGIRVYDVCSRCRRTRIKKGD